MFEMLPRIIVIGGFLSLFHSAYSAAQHRSYLRITEQEFTTLPLDIFIQGCISLFIALYGIMCVAGDFKEIRATVDLETKTWETQRNIASFYTFNHRGKSLSVYYVPQSPTKAELMEIE